MRSSSRAFAHFAVLSLLVACPGRGGTPTGGGKGTGVATAGEPGDPVDPTVVLTPPALRLPRTFAPDRYELRIALDPAATGFTGDVTIQGTLAEPSGVIWLNAEQLTIASATATAGGAEVTLAVEPQPHDFVALRAPEVLPSGPVTLHLRYAGVHDANGSYGVFVQEVAGDKYLFTQLESTAARRMVPCVDEPDRKTPWKITVEAPAGLAVLGNTSVERDEVAGDGKRLVTFAETKPLPTYLLAFAVGPFELVDAGKTPGGAPIRIAAFKGQADRVAWAAQITPRIVEILEAWFGTPYPYDKLDQVPIPATVQFSAMENAGLITYAQNVILMDPKHASDDEKRYYVLVAGHEIAHQWFGNLVTMAWWDDIWLNEAFATWMESKVMGELSPAWSSRVALTKGRTYAMAEDTLLTARRVREPVDDADDIATAFDGITYQKGEAVIRMFEQSVGADTFRDGVRAYLAEHAWGNATSDDFLAAIDKAAGRDLSSGFRTFLDQAGVPRVSMTLTCHGKKEAPVLALRQERWVPRGATAGAERWRLPVCVAYGNAKTRQQQCVELTEAAMEVPLDTKGCPSWLLPNAGALGYYRADLSAEALDDLLDTGWSLMPPHERVVLADDVRAMVDRGEQPIDAELRMVSRLLRDGSREATDIAVAIAHQALEVASDAARPRVVAWIRDTYGKMARKLGWLPDKGDDYARESKRATVVPLVAEIGREQKLLDRAVELAKKWRELPQGARAAVLRGAVVASKDAYAKIKDDALAATDADEREDLYDALGAVDDPAQVGEVLALLLDPRVDLRFASRQILAALGARASTQPAAEAFVRDHVAELLAKMPVESAAELIFVVAGSCDASKRDAAAAWAKQHIEPQSGGVRTSQQALEAMDQCIARKAAMGPALDAWLDARDAN